MQIVAPRPTLGGLMNPLELPDLEAWYDLSRPASTTSDDIRISAANLAALIADKSGNSAVNCLCLNGVAGNTSYVTTGGASIGTGDFTVVADVKCSPTAANGGLAGFRSSIPDASVPGRSFVIDHQFGTPANLAIVLYGAAGTDFRYYRFVNYFSTNAGKRRVITVTRSGTTVKVYSDGFEITPDAEVTGGTAPSWEDTVTSTYFVAGSISASICSTDCIYKARLYDSALSAANVLADYQTGSAGTRRVDIDFTAQAKLTASGFTCGTGQAVTIVATGDLGARIAGERDLYQATASKQPVYLPFSGTKYGYLNGVGNNYFRTPDSVPLSITGNIEIVSYLAPVSWAAAGYIVSKVQTLTERSYWFETKAGSLLRFNISTTGSNAVGADSTQAVPFSANEAGWVKVTRTSADGVTTFYTSSDGTSWTQLGDPVVISAGSAMYDSTSIVEVGSAVGGSVGVINGRIYRAQIYDGINGTLKADFNPALYTSGTTFTASTGEVWTLNGGATIVDRTCIYTDGTDDYMKAPAFALSQPETVYFVGKQVSWTTGRRIYDGYDVNSMSVQQTSASPIFGVQASGTPVALNSNLPLGEPGAVLAIYNSTASRSRVNRTAEATGHAGTANGNGLTLAAAGNVSNFANITVSEILIFSAAHDKATQDRVIQYLGRKWGLAV